jgi:hypothetical protein
VQLSYPHLKPSNRCHRPERCCRVQEGGKRRKGAGRARISTRRRIEALTSEPGPFIWRTSRTAMTLIALD